MTSNHALTLYKGSVHPEFTTNDWKFIDKCFEDQYNYYLSIGQLPPATLLYDPGEISLKKDKEIHLAGMSGPAKRSHEEVETFYDPNGGKDAPPMKIPKLKEPVETYDFHRIVYNEEDGPDIFGGDDYYDDGASEYSDTTDILAELAEAGRLDHLGPLNSPSMEIVHVGPKTAKPSFDFSSVAASSLASLIPGFLAEMKAANGELEAEKAAGNGAAHVLEIVKDEDESEGKPYIEMNIGLGVLEQKKDEDDTSSESDSGTDTDEDVMSKLMGVGNSGEEKKVKIEEL